MPGSAVQNALRRMRGQGPDVTDAASMSAPMPQAPGLDQAYGAPMNPTMQSATPPPNPFAFNQGLEQQAAPNNIPMHPLLQQIMQRFGLLNLIRNQSNQSVADPMSQG